jgi:hypothetical protein
MTPFRRLDLFCRVVDNYGDIGIAGAWLNSWCASMGWR